jgi:hypothetical protein
MQRRSPSHLASRSPWHRWLAGLAVLALVGTQWLGLAHSVLHAPHGGASWVAQSAAADSGFGHDKGSPLCQLFDAAAQADGIAPSVAALPVAAAADLPPAAAPCVGQPQGAPALYSARAPPRKA